ncbi:hypothetical protein FACS1894153_0440 [Bacteroidia bacterium]|nr:hypothetical protein FACS1894153_0440 [Bacteroidia bacterium]
METKKNVETTILSETDQDIIDMLGEPTEDKPEYFEDKEDVIDENIEGFDPPPAEAEPEPIHQEKIIDPEKKSIPKKIISESSHLVAPIVVGLIDSVVPSLIDIYAKTDNPEQFEASVDDKKNMSEALADWIGTSNVQLSPWMVFLFAVVSAYSNPCITAYQLKRMKQKVSDQKSELDKSERERLEAIRQRIDAEKQAEQAMNDLNKIKLENAELAKKAVDTEIKTAKAKKESNKKVSQSKKNGKTV